MKEDIFPAENITLSDHVTFNETMTTAKFVHIDTASYQGKVGYQYIMRMRHTLTFYFKSLGTK